MDTPLYDNKNSSAPVNSATFPNSLQTSTFSLGQLLSSMPETIDEAHNPVRSEIALWRAVITQALMDASSGSQKMEARHEKRRAIHWLLSDREDFETVCHFADLSPSYV